MTNIIKSYKDKNYCVSLYWEKGEQNGIYIVNVCPVLGDNMIGYPLQKQIYCIDDLKNAKRTFNRYVKKYCIE